MKKLLALLLALLLPLCACAETYGFSISVEADEVAFVQLVKAALLADPTVDAAYADTYAKLIQRILDGLSVNLIAQEDAVSMELHVGGGRLFDMTVYEDERAAYMTSSMLPGYALVNKAGESIEENEALMAEFDQTDWTNVCAGVESAVAEWLSVIEPTENRGVFDGDAFKGGTKCTTWMLSDMDIAALADALLTQEVRSVLTIMLTAMSFDADKLLNQFDELNDRVADEDRYLYVLRVVRDDLDNIVGLSLTILDENTQVATASLGLGKEAARLVIGLGLNDQNYWWEFTANEHQQDGMVSLDGVSREWTASKLDGFSYVSAAVAPVSNLAWAWKETSDDAACTWEAEVSSADSTIVSAKGTANLEASTMNCDIILGDAEESLLTVHISSAPAEAIQPLDASLKHCSMFDPADAEIYEQLLTQFSASILARMMKLLPMDLLLMLNDMSIQ